MNKADKECKRILQLMIDEGMPDINPRPHWADGTPAHTISLNGVMSRYDLSKGEWPFITLRPVAVKAAISEILWIYKDASNDLDVLENKYGVHYWNDWAVPSDDGSRTIGACYGETVRRHNLTKDLINGIEKDPDGRRHIISLWQSDDFKDQHGLKPCVFLSNFNVRHDVDNKIDYLDLTVYQRSCDYITAGCTINQVQYTAFLCMIANHFGYTPGVFTWFCNNVQIYDRHIDAAKEMLSRDSVEGINPRITVTTSKSFWDLTPDDIIVTGYDRKKIAEQNPQIKLEVAI